MLALLVHVVARTKRAASSKQKQKHKSLNFILIINNFACRADSKILTKKGLNTPRKDNAPLLQCTHHMCPVRVHWHVKVNYKDYWRVKIAITNFNYRMNHTLWTLAVQHPNLNNVTQVFSFDYKSVAPYGSISKSLTIKDSTF